MDLRIFCPGWGMTETDIQIKLERVREAGFDGVEMGAPKEEKDYKRCIELLERNDLLLIVQVWTTGNTASAHLRSLEEQVRYASGLAPVFVNAQTGKDHFSFADNLVILEQTNTLEKKYGVRIRHETHRGRFAYSAFATYDYLQQLPSLQLTADFSHWCCVSESLLDDQENYVTTAISNSSHIHARVGYPEGPQVTDPRDGEWKIALEKHLTWWDKILEANKDLPFHTITPEFGPASSGYLHTLPFIHLPVADQWEINCYMKDLLRQRYRNKF